MKIFQIGKRKVGNKYPPLIIAEIGINHFGSLKKAKKIVLAAKKSGAEAVKVQIHIPNEEMSEEAKFIKPGNSNKNIYKIIKENSLSLKNELKLKKFIEKNKLIYLATPFSYEAAKWLNQNKVKAFKIGSGECNNIPLVKYICSFGKPIILSTGMNTLNEVNKTVRNISKFKIPLCILHCVNLYPTPDKLVRINRVSQLIKKFPKYNIGYSDHSMGTHFAISAIALGANIIEKHFVIDKKQKGPDVSCSMDKDELKYLIKSSKSYFSAKFNKIEYLKEENVTRKFAFHSVVAKKKYR